MADILNQTLHALLTEERQAILSGAFDKLQDLAGRKEALFCELVQAEVTAPNLRRIGVQVSRNQRLLAAALRGIRDVGDRLGTVREVRDNFSTYDSAGQKLTVAPPRPGFEHKS
jgi:hypothetical protein